MNEQIEILQREAAALHRQGRKQEAIAAYRHLLALREDLGNCWYNLGYLLKAVGDYDKALAAYGHALAQGADHPEEVHLNRAVILADHLRLDDAAERELQAALAIAPNYAPALLNLGNLHEERGRRDEAIACYDRILAATPGDRDHDDPAHRCEALARMAHLRPPLDTGDPLLQQMHAAASTTVPMDDSARANLFFSLGRTCDTLGLHDQAFDALVSGNRYACRTEAGYDRARSERLNDALVATFQRANAAPPKSEPENGAAPLFICGMFRSGTTLVEQALAAHSLVTPGGELDVLMRLVTGPLAPFPASMTIPDPERDRRLARQYRDHMARLFPEARAGTYITDKRPDNFLLIGLIKQFFPSARIVHTTRHPIDTCLSIFMQHLDPRVAGYAGDLGDIGHYYGQYHHLMAHWKTLYGESIHDFDYDDFVRAPTATLAPLLNFLGLEWDDRCLEFHRLGNTVKTASYWQVRQPLYAKASGRWRNYRAHLGPLRQALHEAGVMLDEDALQ